MKGESAIEADCTHAYVARMHCCDALVALMVDDASPSLSREIAKLIRRRRRIERVTIEEARAMGSQLFKCKCPPDEAEKKVQREIARERKKLERMFGKDRR